MVHILSASDDDIAELGASEVVLRRGVVALEAVVFRIADGGIVEVVVLTDEAFHVVTAIVAVAKVLGAEDGGGELTQDWGSQITEGLVHDGLKLRLVVKGQTSYA